MYKYVDGLNMSPFNVPVYMSHFCQLLQPQFIEGVAEVFTPGYCVFVNRSRPTNTLQRNLLDEERQFYPNQPCDVVISFPGLLCQPLRQSFMEDLAFLTHHTFNWEYEWCECAMLYFHNSGIVLAFLFLFVFFEDRRDVCVDLTIAVCIRDAYIEKGILRFSPESLCSYI